jgi:glycyl-tRNA synthetase beta chain
LPREILVTVMRDHQKYFAVEDRKGKVQPRFVTVLNLDRDQKGRIREGHERVLSARFADAEFFWNADQRLPLPDRLPLLDRVTYEAELGSYGEKVRRMKAVAHELCGVLESQGKFTAADSGHTLRAVELAKCDLTTQMVQEFPELQGIVGGLYAAAQGEPPEVHQAVYDHYLPQGMEDPCPRTTVGAVVSLADKLDSVVGGFAVGREPTGSSDPFALRRQGNGIVKVLVEKSLAIPVRPLVEQALNILAIEWRKPRLEVFTTVVEFLGDRLRYYLEAVRKLRYDTVRAVMAAGWDVPVGALWRAEALEGIRGGENFEALSVAAKRIKNILAKSATASDWQPGEVDTAILQEAPERELWAAYSSAAGEAGQLASAGEYRKALEVIAALRPAVDRFFDKVLVMAEDPAVRQNRLRLLGKLDQLFSGLAQFAEIEGGAAYVDASTSKKQ